MWEPYHVLSRWASILAERNPASPVILRVDHWRGAALSARAGIAVRVGSDHDAVCRYLTHTQDSTRGHWVQRNAEAMRTVARILGGRSWDDQLTPENDQLRYDIPDDARLKAAELLNIAGVSDRYVVLHPGSGARVKLWPAARWVEVAREIANQGFWVVVTGSEGEREQANQIARAAGGDTVSIAGRTDLPTLAAVLSGAALVAGVDSGPLHLACAAGAPTLRLYGPSDIGSFGPWGPANRTQVLSAGLVCPKCGDLSPERPEGAGCMTAIGADVVRDAALNMLVHA
jgi:heptosyltransferase-2/heptosyltransferase-3